jgi:hypothetical protein
VQEAEQLPEKQEKDNASLYIALVVAAGLAVILVIITFSMFLRSSTYATVQKIQANEQVRNDGLSDYDTTSPVKIVDIDETLKAIDNTFNGLNPQAEYGPEQVNLEALGVTY